MLVRLLYRLARQGLERRQSDGSRREADARPGGAVVVAPPHAARFARAGDNGAVHRRRTLFALGGALLATAAALWYWTKAPPFVVAPPSDPAQLRLVVPASSTWPVVVYLSGHRSRPPDPTVHGSDLGAIRSAKGAFEPAFQVVPASRTIEISNADAIAHNTHVFYRGDTIFNVALPHSGVTVRKNLPGAGIFEVRCDLHPWMQAWLFAPPGRHFAVLNEPETVIFDDIPPGEYVLHLWRRGRAEGVERIVLSDGESSTLKLR